MRLPRSIRSLVALVASLALLSVMLALPVSAGASVRPAVHTVSVAFSPAFPTPPPTKAARFCYDVVSAPTPSGMQSSVFVCPALPLTAAGCVKTFFFLSEPGLLACLAYLNPPAAKTLKASTAQSKSRPLPAGDWWWNGAHPQ